MIKRYHAGETARRGIYLTRTWEYVAIEKDGTVLATDATRLHPLVVLTLGPVAGLILVLFLPVSAPLYLLMLGLRKLWRMRPGRPGVRPHIPARAFRVLLPILLVLAAAAVAYAAQPGEVVYPGKMLAPAVFKHATHESMKCGTCHPATVKMKRFTSGVTMEAIDQGKYCGTCHDGKQAFSASDKTLCGRCHVTGESSVR